MIVTIDGLPVYNAELDGDDTGMYCISLVEYPAVLRDFQKLSAQERQERERTRQLYAITDEEKQLVRGVVMRADFPIYRRDNLEYYIIYKADTIRQMAEKYLADNLQNQVNLDHTPGAYVEGVQMVQWYLKDTAAGINPEGFEDCADGSLFAEFHVTDPEIWEAVKAGTYKGFSLEGYFALTPEDDQQEVERIVEETRGLFSQLSKNFNMSIAKFKALFAKLVKMRTTTTDQGVIAWDGDDDLAVGTEVFVEDEEGNRTPAPDGVYTLTDGTAVTVADGKVTEIVAPEAEAPVEEPAEAPAEAPVEAEEEPQPEVENPENPGEEPEDEAIAGLRREMNEAYSRINELEEAVRELREANRELRERLEKVEATPAALSAHKELKETKASAAASKRERLARLVR
jgi:hypothetical protein